MPTSFSITRSRYAGTSDSALLAEIRSRTESDEEASSILGCIDRLGYDASIQQYEMTPKKNNRTYRDAPRVAWTVRAIRP